jgi:DNA-binding NtrC family response regulator
MQPTDPARSRAGARPLRRYLLACDTERAWVIDLPERGTIAIGRSSECQVVLADPGVSRVHAEIVLSPGEALVVDRASQNGTRVSGAAIARHVLGAGDVIELGGATLVYHTTERAGSARTVDTDAFAREVEREIARTEVSRRGFAVVSVRAAGASGEQLHELVAGNLRPFEVAAPRGTDELLVLCPEVDSDARAIADQLGALAGTLGAPHVGFASCPHDGVDAAALIAAARAPRSSASEPARPRSLRAGDHEIVVAEAATTQLYALVERLARSELPVLVRGETGVGKEVVAQALHAWSRRSQGPFVAINCAALPEQLAESELFGHERGAFSGAIAAKPGLLESARGGTVLLDEIGDMSLATQAKLLRALETRKITRLGSVEEREIDIRLVAATHRDLDAEVASGRFRRDLYFRLGGGTIVLPPLRDRPRELVLLAETFLAAACAALDREPFALSNDAILELVAYAWPGNVRELKLVMEYLAAAESGRVLTAAQVARRLGSTAPVAAPAPAAMTPRQLRDELADLEQRRMREALDAHDGHQARAAAALGMPLRTFVAKLKRYRIRS